MGTRSKVLVAGASGVVGQAAVRQFSSRPGWDVVAVSRRRPLHTEGVEWIHLDLDAPEQCSTAIRSIRGVTHVVYAALYEVPGLSAGWFDEVVIRRNEWMLRNLMEPLLSSSDIQHVSLLQGTKAYGMHHPAVGWAGVRNPLRERDPRIAHPNFYFRQEDYLREKQRGMSWELTIFRPTVIYGDAIGNNMNLIPVLGAWAALLRDEGRPLDFPGRYVSGMVTEAVDADLVARALLWAAESSNSRQGTFNLTNGDVFLWKNVWTAVAETMGMDVGVHRPTELVVGIPAKAGHWADLVDRLGLRAPRNILEFVGYNSLVYADRILSGHEPPEGPVLNSTIAVRIAGFGDCIDTEDMFRKWFRRMQNDRLLPPPV